MYIVFLYFNVKIKPKIRNEHMFELLFFISPLTFMHLADAFIQSDLQLHSGIHLNQYVCSLGIEPTTFCAADAMLYHWATLEHSLWEHLPQTDTSGCFWNRYICVFELC